MDPSRCAQDVLRCRRCETPVPQLCCDLCKIYLCKPCAGEHIFDESTEHRVVRIEQTLSNPVYPKCSKHTIKHCELYCEHCTVPICVQCVSSNEHQSHKFVDLLRLMEIKKEVIEADLQELETSILTEYKEIASKIPIQKAYIRKTSHSLKTAIDEHGEHLHKEVNAVVKKLKSEVGEKEEKQISSLSEEEEEISQKISSIEECILKQKELQSSKDFSLINDYKSRNEDFRKLRPKHIVTLPTFSANKITTDKLLVQFGSLTIDTNPLEKPKSTEAVGKDLEQVILLNFPKLIGRKISRLFKTMVYC